MARHHGLLLLWVVVLLCFAHGHASIHLGFEAILHHHWATELLPDSDATAADLARVEAAKLVAEARLCVLLANDDLAVDARAERLVARYLVLLAASLLYLAAHHTVAALAQVGRSRQRPFWVCDTRGHVSMPVKFQDAILDRTEVQTLTNARAPRS